MKSSRRAGRRLVFMCRLLLLAPILYTILPAVPRRCLAEDWTVHCEPWPEADRLFKRDSRWRGADAANSIDLGDGRVLWTFGDTFVDTNKDPSQRHRKTSKFIRNSIAIQIGYDPTRAEFRPYWQELEDGTPSSFLRSEGDVFYWPGGGLMLDDQVLLFLMRIINSDARLGFSVAGWGAVVIENPQDNPKKWRMRFIETPQNSHSIMVGSGSSLRVGNWVYSFGAEYTLRHRLYLTRIPVAEALAGNFSKLEWWNGSETDWQKHSAIKEQPPQPIVDRGQTEFTVHREAKTNSFQLTQFQSFPRSPIVIREAQELTGPWSHERTVYVPEEADTSRKGTMVYACKAHPEQAAEGLAVTYCTNTFHLATVRTDESLYYPRFVRFIFKLQDDETAN